MGVRWVRFRACALAVVVAAAAAVAAAPVVGAGGAPRAAQSAGGAVLPFDFDGDGYPDLAVGVPGEDLSGVRNAGMVQVLYGSSAGPTARDQVWHQDRRGIKGTAEPEDMFGTVLASGDFDGDGHADLAVGIPQEEIGQKPGTGAVQVLYGGSGRLTTRDQVWHQGGIVVAGRNRAYDGFGTALAVGDFDSDGFADLAVGVPGERVLGQDDVGRVVLLFGSATGLARSRDVSTVLLGVAREGGRFGQALAACDVTRDGRDDLLVVSGRAGDSRLASTVHVVPGGDGGLSLTRAHRLAAADLGLADGYLIPAMACGDYDGDGRQEIAVRHVRRGGDRVVVARGGPDGQWSLTEVISPGGWSLTSGDLTGDGIDDLVIGPGADFGSRGGAVRVFRGSPTGLRQVALLSQDTPGVPGADERGDEFGAALAILPGAGRSPGWLALGTPGEALGTRSNAGWVIVVPGAAGGVDLGSARGWHQDSPGIKGGAERHDKFGWDVGSNAG